MKTYSAYFTIALMMILGFTTFYMVNAETETVNDPWETWVQQQTNIMLKAAGDIDKERWTEMRTNLTEKFSAIANELKKDISNPPKAAEEYIHLEIEKALKKLSTRDNFKSEVVVELLKELSNGDMLDLGKLTDKGTKQEVHVITSTPKVHVKTYFDKKGFNIPKFNALNISPEVHVEAHVLKHAFDKDLQDLPKNVNQNVKALREAYDTAYNDMLSTSSKYFTHKQDGKTVLKYKIPLNIEEVDDKYPRDEWLQMLLDEEIKINSFYEYQAYLLERDALIQIEKKPKVWTSGLFGIEATDDWVTYKEAYLKERVYKLKPFIRSQIITDVKKINEMKEKILKHSEDMKFDSDEVAEKVFAIVKELDKKSATVFDKDDIEKLIDIDPIITTVTPSITTKPYVYTKVLKDPSTENELENKIEKLVDKIDKLIDKLNENQSQSTETE